MSALVLIPADKLPAVGSRSIVRKGNLCLAFFNVDGALYAIDDSCPHSGGSLVLGKLEGLQVRCPAHGLKFDIRTGCMSVAGGLRVRSYPLTVIDGKTYICPPEIPNEKASP